MSGLWRLLRGDVLSHHVNLNYDKANAMLSATKCSPGYAYLVWRCKYCTGLSGKGVSNYTSVVFENDDFQRFWSLYRRNPHK